MRTVRSRPGGSSDVTRAWRVSESQSFAQEMVHCCDSRTSGSACVTTTGNAIASPLSAGNYAVPCIVHCALCIVHCALCIVHLQRQLYCPYDRLSNLPRPLCTADVGRSDSLGDDATHRAIERRGLAVEPEMPEHEAS
jgi:hypothetical protein